MIHEFRLGDAVEQALGAVGLKEERVNRLVYRWLGKDCGCKDRQQKLNALGAWSSRVLSGKVERAEHYLKVLTECDDGPT